MLSFVLRARLATRRRIAARWRARFTAAVSHVRATGGRATWPRTVLWPPAIIMMAGRLLVTSVFTQLRTFQRDVRDVFIRNFTTTLYKCIFLSVFHCHWLPKMTGFYWNYCEYILERILSLENWENHFEGAHIAHRIVKSFLMLRVSQSRFSICLM